MLLSLVKPMSDPVLSDAPLDAAVCRLYVVRHGETAWNVAGLLQGQLDTDLNERGHRQAHSAALYMRRHLGECIKAVYSSDLLRTTDTAAPIAAAFGLPIIRDVHLRETHFGHWQGSRWDDIESRHKHDHSRWNTDPDFAIAGGGESRRNRFRRLCIALHKIALRHLGQHVVVVTHSGIIDDVGRLLRRVPWGKKVGLPKVNAGISVCEFTASVGSAAAGGSAAAAVHDDLHSVFVDDDTLDPVHAAVRLGKWDLLHWGVTDHLQVPLSAPPPVASGTSSDLTLTAGERVVDRGRCAEPSPQPRTDLEACQGDASTSTEGAGMAPGSKAAAPGTVEPSIDAAATDEEEQAISAAC